MAAILSPGRYFGSVEGRFKSGRFLLVETSYARGERIPAHLHDRPYFCLVVRGDYQERAVTGEVSCRRDTVAFHPEGVVHEDQFGDVGGDCFNVECESSWLRDTASGLESAKTPIYLRDDYATWLTRRLQHEVRTAGGHTDLAIDGLTRALVAAVARWAEGATPHGEPAQGPDWLREALAIAAREGASGIGPSEIARRVGVHPRHLARTFRDLMGCTVGEFLRRQRIEVARRLLTESPHSLSQIAYRSGFADQSHLTRTFKRYVGSTPLEYRRRNQRRPPDANPSL